MDNAEILDTLFHQAVSAIDGFFQKPYLLWFVAEDPVRNGKLPGNIAQVTRAIIQATALCLERWDDVTRLVQTANAREKQMGLVLAALNGKAEALARLIPLGVDLNAPSADLYSHATALHHAVYSGSLEAVKVLVEAGASLDTKDSIYGGTPLDWAEHGKHAEIADYLRGRMAS